MKSILLFFLLQSAAAPPRTAMVDPASLSEVPKNLKKDYDKLWLRFESGKDDSGLTKDVGKFVKKNPSVVAAVVIAGYLDWLHDRRADADQQFGRVLVLAPANTIALSYLAERAFDQSNYGRAVDLYGRLVKADPNRSDAETKRQKALILGTDASLREAVAAEKENRLADAETAYRRALQFAPGEPTLDARLGDLLVKEKKWDAALPVFEKERELGGATDDVQRHIAAVLTNLGRGDEAQHILEALNKTPGRATGVGGNSQNNQLEDLGRWGQEIDRFRQIQTSAAISRDQLALLLLRYFPQLSDLRPTAMGVVVTDVQTSAMRAEIQTVLGLRLMEPFANHTFRPGATVSRGELATICARLLRLLSIQPRPVDGTEPAIADVDTGNARYRDVQLVVTTGIMRLDASGNFDISQPGSGDDAVRAVQRLLELSM